MTLRSGVHESISSGSAGILAAQALACPGSLPGDPSLGLSAQDLLTPQLSGGSANSRPGQAAAPARAIPSSTPSTSAATGVPLGKPLQRNWKLLSGWN